MKPEFDLSEGPFNTQFAPLCVVGQALYERETFKAVRTSELIAGKASPHSSGEKLQDALLLLLAGYPSLYLLNQHLRPDPILAAAWHRQSLAEQSTISRTLDAFDAASLAKLAELSFTFWQRHSQVQAHDWRHPLVLDIDLTPLLASPRAEASSKGYFGEKTPVGVNSPVS